MAGIRGVVNPMPKAGKAPSGIFSTRGSQKMDSTSSFKYKDVQKAAVCCGEKVTPKPRDNRIKKG
jgi:hypothetical protein